MLTKNFKNPYNRISTDSDGIINKKYRATAIAIAAANTNHPAIQSHTEYHFHDFNIIINIMINASYYIHTYRSIHYTIYIYMYTYMNTITNTLYHSY